MKTITIELSKESCNKALKELLRYQKEIKPKLDEVCRRLAEIGKEEALSIVQKEIPDYTMEELEERIASGWETMGG